MKKRLEIVILGYRILSNKLEDELEDFEINQMVNSRAF